MKVLQINPYPPNHLGGSEIFCKNLAINLLSKNVDSTILTSDIFKAKKKTDTLESSIKVIYKYHLYNLWGKNPIVNIYSYLKKNYHKYDIIHAHSYIFFSSLQAAFLKRSRKFPLVLHIHGGISTPPSNSSSISEMIQLQFKNLIFDKVIGKYTIKASDAIISVSNKDLKLITAKYKLQDTKTYYIPNGIDINRFKVDNSSEKKYITFIGRLSYIKGIDIFINFIKKLYAKNDKLEFLIIGSGPLLNLVKDAQKNLPIKHYSYYPYDKIENIYNMSKLVILSSRFEGLPTSLLESLACETPVIANDVGGISEVLKNNENGLLYKNILNPEAINKTISLIADNKKLTNLGKNGKDLIHKDFSWDRITDKIVNVYKDVMNK